MKILKKEKKLVLNRKTISDLTLSDREANNLKGGEDNSYLSFCICPNTSPTICPSCAINQDTDCV